MRKAISGMIAAMAIAGCDMDTGTRDQVGTGIAAGAIGGLTASMLGANEGWTAAAAVAAGTAGALARRHEQSDRCAYYTGDGDEVVIQECRET